MELVILSLMILSLLAVFTVDAIQKRRKFLQEKH